MITDQLITVTNKAQLLVAFGCALDFSRATKITLVRKTGETTYRLKPLFNSWLSVEYFNKCIKKARAKIRSTPAECFK